MTHERTRKRNTQRASEMNLAVILVWIVIMFIVCHLPRIVLNIHEVFMLDESMRECEDEHGGKYMEFFTSNYIVKASQYFSSEMFHGNSGLFLRSGVRSTAMD